jgi:hypothetical protein
LNENLRVNLCKKFCAYFKPSKKEDLVCEGFTVIERCLSNGKPIVFDMPDKGYAYETQEMLTQDICRVCPFYQNDCDFILSQLSSPLNREETKRPLPCGGFILLAYLLESNIIKIDDIRNII